MKSYIPNNGNFDGGKTAAFVLIAGLLFAILLSLSSCKTCQPMTIIEHRDSIVTRYKTDSIQVIERDSVFVHVKGDTVRVEHWRDRWRDRIVIQSDTVRDVQAIEKTVKVRERNGYDKATARGFWILLVCILLRVAWWAVKKYYLHR